MLDLPVLNHTLRECGFKLPRTSNVGRSGDWADLYYLTDYLTFVIDQHYGAQPCKAGCSGCCSENTVFRVTRSEWELIREYVSQGGPSPPAPAERKFRDQLFVRNERIYGGFRDQLHEVAAGWATAEFDAPNPALDGLPAGCPALDGDLCALYEVRPLVCRAYGYMAATIRGKESLLICRAFGERFLADLRAEGRDQVPLPNFEPFARRLASLDGSAEVKPLPLWLFEWAIMDGK